MTMVQRLLLLALVPLLGLPACALFEELYGRPQDAVGDVLPPITFPVEVPMPIVLGDGGGNLPADPPPGTTLDLPPVYVQQDLRSELPDEVPVDRVDRIELTGISRICTSNDLNVQLDPMEIRAGGGGTTWESALEAAILPALAPGQTGEVDGELNAGNRAAIGQALASLDFGIGFLVTFTTGQAAPTGAADCTLVLTLRVFPRI